MAPPPRGPKQRFQLQDSHSNRAHKRNQKHRNAPYAGGNARPHKRALRPIKDRIRDVERMLKAAKMPADVLQGRERELAALYHELVTVAAEKEKQKMIERYHMVRFFDRKKAERRLNKVTKALNDCKDPEARTKLDEELHTAQIDLNYTQYYPLILVYSSLYPTKTGNDKVHNGVRGNSEIWKEVEQATMDGKLDELRNRVDLDKIRTMTLGHGPQPASRAANQPGKSSRGGVRLSAKKDNDSGVDSGGGVGHDAKMDDDDSDGGFFE